LVKGRNKWMRGGRKVVREEREGRECRCREREDRRVGT
jgi:hypothetical protein